MFVRLLRQLRSRSGLLCIFILVFVVLTGTTAAANIADHSAQQVVNEVGVIDGIALIDRLSWGAVIAGAILGLVLQFALNLLGISFGFAGVNPTPQETIGDELRDMTRETVIWMGASMLVALFAAGWVAGRFAGVFEPLDGLLHGLLVWAVVMLISILLLLTSLGRILSGMTNLIGRGFNLAGQVARTTAQGAANVAQATARGTENVMQRAVNQVEDAARSVSQNGPQTDGVQNRAKMTYDEIMAEARQILRESGLAPERLEYEVETAKEEIQQGVQRAVQNPAQAENALQETLTNIFRQGRAVASSVDRDKVVSLLTSRTNMSEVEARRMLNGWEERFEQARQQLAQDAHRTREEAEMKVEEVKEDIEQRVEDLREDVEETARDVTRQTTDTIAKFASAIFAAMIVSGIAAAIGGLLGTPV